MANETLTAILKSPHFTEEQKNWAKNQTPLTQWRITVYGAGMCLTRAQYMWQLKRPDNGWCCPYSGAPATWDDDWYEAWEATVEEQNGD